MTPALHIQESAEMSYDEAFALASKLHRGQQFEPAERLYRALRELQPADPNPMHYLGVLLHQRGRNDEALSLIRASIEADPGVASWHNNLGNVLLEGGRIDEAAAAYLRSGELDPEHVEALNNLGVLQRVLGQLDAAETTLKRALERRPDFANAHSNLASVYYAQGRILDGYRHSAEALALNPGHPRARKVLAMIYARLGRLEDAARIFREWLEHEPDNPQPQHYLVACTGQGVPDRATDRYVETEFDAFADSFESRLAALEYRAPQLVGEAVARLHGTPLGTLRIVDAGCGTGLCAPLLAPYARALVGVDLSAKMLEKAGARGAYAQLVKAELVQFLTEQAALDLVVSADTLCYFGRLDEAMQAVHGALRPGGHVVFTVEAHEAQDDHRLNAHGRYSHRDDYLRRVLGAAGMVDARLEKVVLRHDSGEPVAGWLVTARRAGDAEDAHGL